MGFEKQKLQNPTTMNRQKLECISGKTVSYILIFYCVFVNRDICHKDLQKCRKSWKNWKTPKTQSIPNLKKDGLRKDYTHWKITKEVNDITISTQEIPI